MSNFWTFLTALHSVAGPLLMLLYPLYASVVAMQSRTNGEQWLAYWIIYSFLTLTELLLQSLLEWIPIWYSVKLVFIAWLVLPRFQGAAFIYNRLRRVREHFKKHGVFRSSHHHSNPNILRSNPSSPTGVNRRRDTRLTRTDAKKRAALKIKADFIIAKDGTGNFTTVKDAVASAPENSKTRFIIYLKKGVYDEIVNIGKTKTNLTIIGEGMDSTVLTGNIYAKVGIIKTFDTATLGVDGVGFMAQDICIRNTAGPEKGQAVALRVSADMAVIYRCRIDGYQDTLYPHSRRQFYRDCLITGTVDFIFGHASAVFQHCNIEPRKPKEGQANMMTAQSCADPDDRTAFSFHKCSIKASPDLAPLKGTVKTYLGRPWKAFSTVVIMKSFVDDLIDPAGWFPWEHDKEARLSTLFYAEYENNGPGADTSRRVNWPGYKRLKKPDEAAKFTVGQLLLRGGGDMWLNSFGVPYDIGL